MIMLFAMIHEFGHLLAGILLGMKPAKIEIRPFGVSIDFDIKGKDNKEAESKPDPAAGLYHSPVPGGSERARILLQHSVKAACI